MLLKHSAYYLLARGIPGLINFFAIAIYTRLLAPEEYGRYALVVAGVGFFNTVFFQWLRLSLLRFLPAHLENPKPLLSTIFSSFSVLAIFTSIIGLLLAFLWPDPTWRGFILIAILLLWAQAWFELNLEFLRSQLQPVRYGLTSGLKAVLALSLGALAVLFGLSVYGPILGLIVGMLFSSLFFGTPYWKGIGFGSSKPLLKELFRYGVPLTGSFVLAFIVSASDRFLIAAFLGEGPAGTYAASYDLPQQILTLLMAVISLAGYPLAVRQLETKGEEAARQQLLQNGRLLFGIALPATAGLIILAPNIANVFLGINFRGEGAKLIPVVALAIFFSGIRAYYFDLAFQLSRKTIGQVWVMGIASILNISLNLWWIPRIGLLGAAYATLVSYLTALFASIYLGRRIFQVPINWKFTGKLVLATGLMSLFLIYTRDLPGLFGVAVNGAVGVLIYGLGVLAFSANEVRSKLRRFFKEIKS